MATGTIPTRTATSLGDDEAAAFHRDGYVRLGKVLDDAALVALRTRIDAIMLGEIRDDWLMMQLDSESGDYGDMPAQTRGFKGATLDYRKIQDLERDPLFLEYLRSPLNRSICERLVGPDITIWRSMVMNKPARRGTVLPWHQDGGDIWGMDIDPIVTLWLALDPATVANGCVQIIPGSHHLGLLSKRGHTITPEQQAEHCAPERIVHLELQAGEVVLMHNWLLHRSDRNATDAPRRAFSVCLMDAKTRHKRCPNQTYFRLF